MKATAAPEMLQVHRGDHLAGLFLLIFLVLAINISKYDTSLTPVNGWDTPLQQNYPNGRGLNIDRRKLNALY